MFREEYPSKVEDYIKKEIMRDYKEVYTNGAYFITLMELRKMLKHYFDFDITDTEIELEKELRESDKE